MRVLSSFMIVEFYENSVKRFRVQGSKFNGYNIWAAVRKVRSLPTFASAGPKDSGRLRRGDYGSELWR